MAASSVHRPLVLLVSIFLDLTTSGYHDLPGPTRHWDGGGREGGSGSRGGDSPWTKDATVESGHTVGFGTRKLGSRLKAISTESRWKGRTGSTVGVATMARKPRRMQQSLYDTQGFPMVDIIGGDFVINHLQTGINHEEGNNRDQIRTSIHSRKEKKNKSKKNTIKLCSRKPWRVKAIPCKVPSTLAPSMTFFKISTLLHRLTNGECDTVFRNLVARLRSPARESVIGYIPVARCDDGLVGCSFGEPFPIVWKYASKNATIQISNETHFGFLSFTYTDAAGCTCTNVSTRDHPYPKISGMYLDFEGLERKVSSHCYDGLLLT